MAQRCCIAWAHICERSAWRHLSSVPNNDYQFLSKLKLKLPQHFWIKPARIWQRRLSFARQSLRNFELGLQLLRRRGIQLESEEHMLSARMWQRVRRLPQERRRHR